MKEYLDQILAGEKSPEPLFQDPELVNERYMLARQGIELERVIRIDGHDVILNLIYEGRQQEMYETWKNHPNAVVRRELARYGYFLDEYIYDVSTLVRREVIRAEPKQAFKLLAIPTDKNLTLVRNWLVQQAHPNIELLERYIQEPKAPHIYLDELQSKHKALTQPLTTFERTMTDTQLFKAGNPAWARDYTPALISTIQGADSRLKRKYGHYNNYVKILLDSALKLFDPTDKRKLVSVVGYKIEQELNNHERSDD